MKSSFASLVAKSAALCGAVSFGFSVPSARALTTIVSNGKALVATQANAGSTSNQFSFSADGTKVAFTSNATNLVGGDTNGVQDVFVRNLATGVTVRASIATDGTQANIDSYAPFLSADGTKVAFYSTASNLVSGDTNGKSDVFVRDLTANTTTRVSIGNGGVQANDFSNNGTLSADGTKVAFVSQASNLVSGDTNSQPDIFVRDLSKDETTRISVKSNGGQLTSASDTAVISANGNKVAFLSNDNTIVSGDTNTAIDVFVRDLTTNTTVKASVSSGGAQANNDSLLPTLSPDGNLVAFASGASNLVSGDTNGYLDVFVRNLSTNTTTRVSLDSSGAQGNSPSTYPSLSSDGTKVAFSSIATNLVSGDTNGVTDIFVRNLSSGVTTRASVGDSNAQSLSSSSYPSLSADGTKVSFSSSATNLVSDDNNGAQDVFVRDVSQGSTALASLSSGTFNTAPSDDDSISSRFSFSADGTRVAFSSGASNLVSGDTNGTEDIFVTDLNTGVTTRASIATDGTQTNDGSYAPTLSADGTKVAFHSGASNLVSGDTNNTYDVFLRDLTTGVTTRVSVDSNGNQANGDSLNPSLSADGTKIAFQSSASNLVGGDSNGFSDIFVRDLGTGSTTRVSVVNGGGQPNQSCASPSISADGTKVVFESSATNLVSGDTNGKADIFVRDLSAASTSLVSLANNGTQGNDSSSGGAISGDGTRVVFVSAATNLVGSDTNGVSDIFVRNLTNDTTTLVSLNNADQQGNLASSNPSINDTGNRVAFSSDATNLVGNDTNNRTDIFVRDLSFGLTVRASVDSNGVQANDGSYAPSLGDNGGKVTYYTAASNLVSSDTNGFQNVFVTDVVFPTALNISDASVTEGNSGTTTATFTVALSKISATPITVQYTLSDVTTDSNDHSPAGGTLTIPPGSNIATLGVTIKGDTLTESDETFLITLSNPSGAVLKRAQGVGTIVNDDNAPTGIALSNNTIAEDAGANALVGTLSANDPDAVDSFTFSLPPGLNDNASFSISGNQLRAVSNFDYETKNSYLITVRVTDNGGRTFDQQFTITVTLADVTKPTIVQTAPFADQKLLISALTAGSIRGTASDNIAVVKVEMKLMRLRNGVTQIWNGSAFTTANVRTPVSINDSDINVNWVADQQFPSQAQLDEGQYIVLVYATDAAGNQGSTSTRFTLVASDTEKPVNQVFTPTLNQKILISAFTSGAANTISGNATDNVGVTGVKVRLSRKRGTQNFYWNGNAFTTAGVFLNATVVSPAASTTKWNLDSQMPPASLLDSGLYQIESYAVDASNNKSATIVRPFTLGTDFTAPSVEISNPIASQKININSFGAGTINGTAADNIGVVSVKVKLQRKRNNVNEYWNGSAFTATSATVDATVTSVGSPNVTWSLDNNLPTPATGLDTGAYTVYATSFDAAGNSKASASRGFSLTGTPAAADAGVAAEKSAGSS